MSPSTYVCICISIRACVHPCIGLQDIRNVIVHNVYIHMYAGYIMVWCIIIIESLCIIYYIYVGYNTSTYSSLYKHNMNRLHNMV